MATPLSARKPVTPWSAVISNRVHRRDRRRSRGAGYEGDEVDLFEPRLEEGAVRFEIARL
jgi:hypothetical protein